jgi:magnesium chelatase subunit H
MVRQDYVAPIKENMKGKENMVAEEPLLLPDKAIRHPMTPDIVFETNTEYHKWYENEFCPDAGIDPNTAPDDTHYVSLISEVENRGAKVVAVYSGGLDYSGPVAEHLYDRTTGKPIVDTVVNLTGFALVGGPASQDHKKAARVLKDLNVPYMCAVPHLFQSFEEWQSSELGLHPIKVARPVSQTGLLNKKAKARKEKCYYHLLLSP